MNNINIGHFGSILVTWFFQILTWITYPGRIRNRMCELYKVHAK